MVFSRTRIIVTIVIISGAGLLGTLAMEKVRHEDPDVVLDDAKKLLERDTKADPGKYCRDSQALLKRFDAFHNRSWGWKQIAKESGTAANIYKVNEDVFKRYNKTMDFTTQEAAKLIGEADPLLNRDYSDLKAAANRDFRTLRDTMISGYDATEATEETFGEDLQNCCQAVEKYYWKFHSTWERMKQLCDDIERHAMKRGHSEILNKLKQQRENVHGTWEMIERHLNYIGKVYRSKKKENPQWWCSGTMSGGKRIATLCESLTDDQTLWREDYDMLRF